MCIFAYGQTGSGKTHTMLGSDIDSAEGRGINFRALEDLFELGRQRQDEVNASDRGRGLPAQCCRRRHSGGCSRVPECLATTYNPDFQAAWVVLHAAVTGQRPLHWSDHHHGCPLR